MSRNVMIGGVVVIALAIGGWWYLNMSSAPAISETTQFPTTQTAQQQNTNAGAQPTANHSATAARTITGTGFEATMPSSWKVASQTSTYASLSSPDYVAKSGTEIMQAEMRGEATGVVKRGAMIEIVPQGENQLSASIQDPAAYVRFRMESNYSNQIENKEISLGGQSAWLLQTRRDDGTLLTHVNTVRNGKEFLITLHAANESGIDAATWNAFLASFKFQ